MLVLPKNWRDAGHGLFACALPRRKDLLWAFDAHGIQTAIDLTRRPRLTIERACRDLGITYLKIPTEYDANPVVPSSFALPAVVFCFHGRDRTGRFLQVWKARHANPIPSPAL